MPKQSGIIYFNDWILQIRCHSVGRVCIHEVMSGIPLFHNRQYVGNTLQEMEIIAICIVLCFFVMQITLGLIWETGFSSKIM